MFNYQGNVWGCVANEHSCKVRNKTYNSSGMLLLSFITNSSIQSQPKFYIQKTIYNLSSLSDSINVVNFTGKPFSLSHNIIVDVAKIGYLEFPSIKECVIMFTCRFEFHYSLGIGLLILIFLPTLTNS